VVPGPKKSIGLTQAVRLYPKAVGWSLLLSTAIVIEGCDTMLLGIFMHSRLLQNDTGSTVPKQKAIRYAVEDLCRSGSILIN
jgi:hypothetical protein